jgi:hypothetical protein
MRLGLLDRVRRLTRLLRPGKATPDPAAQPSAEHVPAGYPADSSDVWAGSSGRHRAAGRGAGGDGATVYTEGSLPPGPPGHTEGSLPSGSSRPAVRIAGGRARIREAPPSEQGIPSPRAAAAVGVPRAGVRAATRTATEVGPPPPRRPVWRAAHASLRARLPFTAPHSQERPSTGDGRRNCGTIEGLIWRQWDAGRPPPAQVISAIDRLAELPERIKARLADGLDAIFIGPGGVPELDDMTALRGVKLPSGHASWDACAGAYGERKIVVGSQPSPTPDVMCHEIGHALDDIDSPAGKWQSDSAEFRMLYDQCQSHFASDFHRQPGGLGRKEFFADAFAAIASGQRPALVDMLSGETRTALRVMLYFNRRYDI